MKLYLTRGKVALIDDADGYLSQWTWCAHRHQSGKYYVVRSKRIGGKKVTIRLSRVILGLTDPKVFAEHKNGNTLDNRRGNLRPATNAQNQANTGLSQQNTKGVKGVSCSSKRTSPKKWQAKIRFGGKRLHLGHFLTMEEAGAAYLKKAEELHGEFVRKKGGKQERFSS